MTLLALCGFRCSGKSFVRHILTNELSTQVFDTNSVPTGDSDADQISIDEVINRYGDGKTYFHFLIDHLKLSIEESNGLLVIDSLKTKHDRDFLINTFPDINIRVLFIHAPFSVRNGRYHDRDVTKGIRTEALLNHDNTLMRHGFADLCLNADYVISNVFGKDKLAQDLAQIINLETGR